MTLPLDTTLDRRSLIKTSGQLAAAGALLSSAMPHLYAGQSSTVKLALVGCGGRGTGAVGDALSNASGPTELVAMADVFQDNLTNSYRNIKDRFGDKVNVTDDRKFVGFDGYKAAMDCLKPGDVVILTTPVAFRNVMFAYAIERGLNVFMEKPITMDGPSSRKMLELGELSVKKNLKVGVGLMCRHCIVRGELHDRIQNGEIGDLVLLRAYRQAGPTGNAFVAKKPDGIPELMYQIKNFHGFLWASGGGFSDFLIHNIDEACWMKNGFPVEAKGAGGRHYRGEYVDQNFDNYSVEYTFDDGAKLYLEGRTMVGAHNEFATYAHGTKGSAIVSTSGHMPAKSRIFKGQKFVKDAIQWQGPAQEPSPYQLEWDHLINAIQKDLPYNEVKRGAMASLVTFMGRLACHTGQPITQQDALEHEHDLTEGLLDSFKPDSVPPVQAGPDGKYPTPLPGLIKNREF